MPGSDSQPGSHPGGAGHGAGADRLQGHHHPHLRPVQTLRPDRGLQRTARPG